MLILEHFRELLARLFEVLGWLGGHFGDALLTFSGNVGSCQMYEKP